MLQNHLSAYTLAIKRYLKHNKKTFFYIYHAGEWRKFLTSYTIIIIIILIIIPGQCHRDKVAARVHPDHLKNAGQRQVAADLQTKPTDSGCKFACRLQAQHPPSPFIITQPESWYSFYHSTEVINLAHNMLIIEIISLKLLAENKNFIGLIAHWCEKLAEGFYMAVIGRESNLTSTIC